ncbi:hypothetical protein M3226_28705 [Neobacillus cucumis]|uniref:hypothetical protein n=1 Tax=Neobacillus cucumis TaxID=1740721 RepID=UPI00203F5D00|nr:hypothetical protein [Neobacillus cucumis]MCM3729567.1 hypothetical protein [Neobacillus cucumis]
MKLLKAAVVVLMLLSLSACDEKKAIQKEIKKKIVEFQSGPTKENKPSFINQKGPTPSDIYGFWVNKDSYIVISNYHGRYQFKQYVKNESQNIKLFAGITQDKNKFSGIFVNAENLGDKISLELNDRKDELKIVTKNGENTYKFTDITPNTYVTNF